MFTTMKKLGNFEITSGEMVVSDPCYDLDTWCMAVVKAKNGTWTSFIELSDERKWGIRVKSLYAVHESIEGDINTINSQCTTAIQANLGVDSGQLGFFDKINYRNDNVEGVNNVDEPLRPDKPWYSLCCDKTLSGERAGVIPYGVVSSSGFGDGNYLGTVKYDNENNVVAIHVNFI